MLYSTVDMSYESYPLLADIGTIVYRCTFVVISVLYVYVHFINSALSCVILVVAFGYRRLERWQFFEEAAKFLYVTVWICVECGHVCEGGWGEKKRRRRREEKRKRKEKEEEKEEIGEGKRKRREEEERKRGGKERREEGGKEW